MVDDKQQEQPSPLTTEDMDQSIQAAHNIVRIDDDGTTWERVGTDGLDPSQPLTARENKMVKVGAQAVERHIADKGRIEELEDQVRIDELTGAWNINVLNDDLPRALEIARREEKGLALWEIDGKNLGEVNNLISRSAGNEYLIAIASALRSAIRTSDGVYRGGKASDEFFVLMPIIQDHGEDADLFLREKETEFERKLAELVRENSRLREAGEKTDIGQYIGVAFIDFSTYDPANSLKSKILAKELMEEADSGVKSAKKRAKSAKQDD